MRKTAFSSRERTTRQMERNFTRPAPELKRDMESFIRKTMNAVKVENAAEGVVFELNGRIIGLNRRVTCIFGTGAAQTLWSHLNRFIAPESLFRLAHCLDPDCRATVRVQAKRRDGRTFDLQLQRLASFNWRGREIGIISLIEPGKTKPPTSRVKLPAQLRFSF